MPGHDANTQLLLHMDGEASGVIFVDSTGTFAVTAGVNTVTSITQKKFGRTSLYLDGSSYLQIADDAIFDLFANNTDSRTLEMWVYPITPTSGTIDLITHYVAADTFWTIRAYGSADMAVGILFGGSWDVLLEPAASPIPQVNTWQHIAFVKEANEYSVYLDGNAIANLTDNSVRSLTGSMFIGARDSGATNGFLGYIDEIRLSNIARYTDDFTPQTRPFYRHGIGKIGGWDVKDVHKINGIYVGAINKYAGV